MSKFVYVVDSHVDIARERLRAVIDQEASSALPSAYTARTIFDTELEALRYMLERANKRVEAAKDKLAREEKRRRMCREKFEKYRQHAAESTALSLASKAIKEE